MVVLLSILLHARILTEPPTVYVADYGLLQYAIQPLAKLPAIALSGIYLLFVTITALRLNFISVHLKMHQKQGYTIAMSYVLLSAIFSSWSNIIPALFINLLMAWIFLKIGKSYNTQQPRTMVYNVGLLTGCAILLYHPLLIMSLICIAAIAIVRPFRINEWIIVLLGIITPFYFLAFYLFMNDELATFRSFLPTIDWHFVLISKKILLANLIYIAIVFMLGVYYWQTNIGKMLIQGRKQWYICLIIFLCFLPVPFMYRNSGIEAGMLAALPLSVFVSNIFQYPRQSLLPGFIFWLTIALVIANQWFL